MDFPFSVSPLGIAKFLWFCALAIVVWLLQCVLPAQFYLFSGSAIPSGWMILVLLSGAFEFPDERAVVLGIFCGLLEDLGTQSQFALGEHTCIYGLAGLLIATQSQMLNLIPVQFFLSLSMTFVLLAIDYLTVLWNLNGTVGYGALRVWNKILASAAFNAVIVLTLFPLLRWLWHRYVSRGGWLNREKWALYAS